MKTNLQRLFLLLLLSPLCMVASAAIGEVTRTNSELTHVDVGGSTLSSITLTVTLGADEVPNGMAMLRTSTDPNNQVNNGANFLVDGTLTKTSSDEASSTWTISWRNVPAGDYKVYFKQTGGAGQTELGDVTISVIPNPGPPTVTFDIVNETCKKKGSITINIAGGKPGFTIKGNVYTLGNAEKAPINVTTTDRALIIKDLIAGEYVRVIVTDAGGQTTGEKDIWSERVGNSSVKVSHEQKIYLLQTADCTFDYYLRFAIDCNDEANVEKQTQMLAETLRLLKYGDSKEYYMEYAPAYNYSRGSMHYRFFGISASDVPGLSHFGFKYDTMCQGSVKTRDSYGFIKDNIKMMSLTTSSSAKVNPETCEYIDKNFLVKYKFSTNYDDDKWWMDCYYFFLNDDDHKYAKVYKQKADGTYETEPVKTDVLMPTNAFKTPFSGSFTLEEPGKYKLVYGTSDCPQTFIEKEFEIEVLKPKFVEFGNKWMSPTIDPKLGIHGKTAGLRIDVKNAAAPLKFTLKRPDGKTSFVVTDFLSDKEYPTTIAFPQEVIYSTAQKAGYFFGDLPEGEYELEVEDKCAKTATYNFTITSDKLQTYTPKRTDGFKDGLYIGVDCNGNNTVKFDFGPKASTLAYGYKISTGESSSSTGDTWSKTDVPMGKNYFAVAYAPGLEGADGVNRSYSYVYSAIAKEARNRNQSMLDIDPNKPRDYDYAPYSADFDKISGGDAFEVFGAMCDLQKDNTGIISVGPKAGTNVSMPVKYELYAADNNGNILDPSKTIGNAFESSDASNVNTAWNGLTKGFYAVTITYGNGCTMKKIVEVNASGIPDPIYDSGKKAAKEITIDITRGMKPIDLALPVSTYIYDVKWIDITNNKKNTEPLPNGTGNEYYATFTKPGDYTYRVQTNFTDKTACKGSSGGYKDIVFHVTQANLWFGSVSTDFSTASNWTANRVLATGEDIVFATKDNYGANAVNDCRLANGIESLDFEAGKLENQSAKAMVIPAGSGLKVTNMVGFEHKTGEPVRLKIEAEAGKPNGAFVYAGAPSDAKVFAEVQMNVKSTKLPTATTWKDNVQGSPTFGENLPVAFTDQFFGIPFKQTSSVWLGGSYIYKYDEAINASNKFYQKFTGLKAKEMMTAFAGYSIRSTAAEAKVKSMKGYLNLGDVTLTLTRKASEVAGATGSNAVKHWGLGQNLFGNSYTAPMKISGLSLPDALDKTIYMYNTGSGKDWGDATSQSGTSAGTYLAVPVNTASQQGVNEIPSMQGFLLKFTAGETTVDGADVKVGLKYDNLVTNAKQEQMAKGYTFGTNTQPGVVRFILNGEDVSDVMWLFEQPGTSDDFDNGWDGQKLGAEMMSSMIYSDSKAGKLQVNTTDDLTKANITIVTAKPGRYVLNLSRKDLPQYSDLKLIDSKAKMIVPFEGDALEYEFDVTENGVLGDRFKLMNTMATSFGNLPTEIQGVTTATWNGPAVVYTVSGERVANVNQPKDLMRLKAQLPNGVYIVSMQVDGKTVSQKMVITK
ncbi:T9SS type A sorting domain-containing protein [Hoylesella buccalis]|uniref:T9SS type A sorting domain-containing protein n=1 Tax=Hoylesella buccalis TaxID=28127 RepID=UPI000A75B06B|nr:T9SS type A sorting domain-containing protein [Hoylesella buccalis]